MVAEPRISLAALDHAMLAADVRVFEEYSLSVSTLSSPGGALAPRRDLGARSPGPALHAEDSVQRRTALTDDQRQSAKATIEQMISGQSIGPSCTAMPDWDGTSATRPGPMWMANLLASRRTLWTSSTPRRSSTRTAPRFRLGSSTWS